MAAPTTAVHGPSSTVGLALVLEDDACLQAVLVDVLRDEGIAHRVCESYAELRAAAAEGGVVAVLADFWGSSHLELAAAERQEIRELGGFASTILLTGRTWARRELAEELGVVCLLRKPLDIEELVAQLRRCLEAVQSP
jgi:DNA-binding response OmpR family regulator